MTEVQTSEVGAKLAPVSLRISGLFGVYFFPELLVKYYLNELQFHRVNDAHITFALTYLFALGCTYVAMLLFLIYPFRQLTVGAKSMIFWD
jgi:hypothetical protein